MALRFAWELNPPAPTFSTILDLPYIDVYPFSGDTLFTSQVQAYQRLSPAIRGPSNPGQVGKGNGRAVARCSLARMKSRNIVRVTPTGEIYPIRR